MWTLLSEMQLWVPSSEPKVRELLFCIPALETWSTLCAGTEHEGDGSNARSNNELLPSRPRAPVLCARPRPPGCY